MQEALDAFRRWLDYAIAQARKDRDEAMVSDDPLRREIVLPNRQGRLTVLEDVDAQFELLREKLEREAD